MGNSTRTLQDIVDVTAVLGDISPQANPSGYGPKTTLAIGTRTMRAMIAKRFNWKWNSEIAAPFYTNSWQQDYPVLGLTNIGWLEDYYFVDINNSQVPPPQWPGRVERDLPAVGQSLYAVWQGPSHVAWRYNRLLNTGTWPGAGVIYYPLLGQTPARQNAPMAITDVNKNILILTTPGTTGTIAPSAPSLSAESTTVTDGTCVWTVVNPYGQGWRAWPLPPASGPVYQCIVTYQKQAPTFTDLEQTLDPIPDDYSHYFETGFKAYCHEYSQNPDDRAKFPQLQMQWLGAMQEEMAQGQREAEAYGLVPAANPVADVYGYRRNPNDPSTPI